MNEKVRVAGPFGVAVTELPSKEEESNPLVVLRRFALLDDAGNLRDSGAHDLITWAVECNCAQNSTWISAVLERRRAALSQLRLPYRELRARPEWRLAVGLGDQANPHEIGIALHGTYGWPIIPGSALKGLAAAWARKVAPDDVDTQQRIFGTTTSAGSVRFFDALPAGEPVRVLADVRTPPQQPYYTSTSPHSTHDPKPPGEHHNPVPLPFVALKGTFAVHLTSRTEADLDQAVHWLREAAAELGNGARTTVGYGYLKLENT